MTMMFLIIIMGATHKKVLQGFAPLPIGLGLTLIHLREHLRIVFLSEEKLR
jgi:aquaporin Z